MSEVPLYLGAVERGSRALPLRRALLLLIILIKIVLCSKFH